MEDSKALSIITFLLKLIVEIACFICACILCSLSSKNPLEKHIIGDISNYFKEDEISTPITNGSQNVNITFEPNRIKENIPNDYKNISLEKDSIRTIIVRKLTSEVLCSEIYEYFVKFKGKTLNSIFDLNYDKIHKISIAILVMSCVIVFIFIIALIYIIRKQGKCFFTYYIFTLIFYVTRFILSIILFYGKR